MEFRVSVLGCVLWGSLSPAAAVVSLSDLLLL